MFEMVLRLIFSLAVVLGIIALAARAAAKRRGFGAEPSLLRIIHRQPLSRTSSLTVAEVEGRVLLLGVTEQHISLVAELSPSSAAASLSATDAEVTDENLGSEGDDIAAPSFAALLSPMIAEPPSGRHRAGRRPATAPLPSGDRTPSRTSGFVLAPSTWRSVAEALKTRSAA